MENTIIYAEVGLRRNSAECEDSAIVVTKIAGYENIRVGR